MTYINQTYGKDLPLFNFEDVLSKRGLEQVWLDALELSRHPENVPYGDLTAEDVICLAMNQFGLKPNDDADELHTIILERASGYADYEREQFLFETSK